MTKHVSWALAGASLFALAACGGGGSDGDGGREEFSLSSKSGALRELALAGLVLGEVPDAAPAAAAALAAKKVGGGSGWGKVPLREAPGNRPKVACPVGGSYTVDSSTKNRSFPYFSVGSTAVSFEREVDSNCDFEAEVPQGFTGLKRLNGIFEFGDTATLGDGSRIGYYIDGNLNSNPREVFSERQVVRSINSNAIVFEEFRNRLGTVEQRETSGGAIDVRAVYGYSYDSRDSSGSRPVDYSSFVQLGNTSTNAPFRGLSDDEDLTLNGLYAYETSECKGGEVSVSTEDTLELQTVGDEQYPIGGRLRLASGDKFAVFTFNTDGGATLNLNGTTQTLTPAEVRNAIDDPDC
ncbi:hypothetical protein [Solimonas sp. K1W22B-7]|uniref:hypothetical protein n=1 Tax=Solimonas sp. K1W22B-7 TaxID=2303331 RepID=UPI0013C4F061|nr:hypothetical protein [Solimonas sp. K1W22B-7]